MTIIQKTVQEIGGGTISVTCSAACSHFALGRVYTESQIVLQT
jgi:hypothetical protein